MDSPQAVGCVQVGARSEEEEAGGSGGEEVN